LVSPSPNAHWCSTSSATSPIVSRLSFVICAFPGSSPRS
jgi:hypothetical protein